MRNRLREHPVGLHLGLMLALTFSTGVIDAVGYLGLDRVFTGNMTGNVVILGMALVGADDLPIFGPIVALIGFMLGAVVAGRTLRSLPAGWTTHSTALLAAVAVVISASAIITGVSGPDRPEWVALTVTGLLGLAMGIQAGAARHIAVKDVTTVVVTSTMVGLAFDSYFGQRGGQPWKRRLGALILIGAGAAAGAYLLNFGLVWGMTLSAVISIIVAILGHIGRPHPPKPEKTA
ncbi:YoaK family protein [Marisediminicola senii]|uniref:YoaK family protein n=1 Tax=Marisediminicola senii TaxID=2711233 RepID=UPI001F40D9F9|nr:YoaK family protein [Marisediminicola senii]